MGSRSDEGRSLAANLTDLFDLASTAGSTDLFADEPSSWPLTELSPPVTSGRNHQRQQASYPQSLVLDITASINGLSFRRGTITRANLTDLLDLASPAGPTDLFADEPSSWSLTEFSPPVTPCGNRQC
jgi:hypothetical protein